MNYTYQTYQYEAIERQQKAKQQSDAQKVAEKQNKATRK